jgi:lipoyl(octanoyl) transferase
VLEDTTIATLGRVFQLTGFTTGDPGVWVSPSPSPPPSRGGGAGDANGDDNDGVAKIAALGVHLRRHVTALGTAINVAMPGSSRGEVEGTDEAGNPWARIVACGLEGRGVTSVAGQLGGGVAEVDALLQRAGFQAGESGRRERGVAAAWAEELARRVEVAGGVEVVSAEETLTLMERLVRESDGASEDWDETTREEEMAYLARIKGLLGGR